MIKGSHDDVKFLFTCVSRDSNIFEYVGELLQDKRLHLSSLVFCTTSVESTFDYLGS